MFILRTAWYTLTLAQASLSSPYGEGRAEMIRPSRPYVKVVLISPVKSLTFLPFQGEPGSLNR